MNSDGGFAFIASRCKLLRQSLCPVILALTALVFGMARADEPANLEGQGAARITVADLKRHCGTLASDALEGREAGSTGGKAAAAYLISELQKINGIIPAQPGWMQEFRGAYRNIVAVLPGSDPELRHELVIIGAHYDHVGRGNAQTSHGGIGSIHNGADDNASGTSAVLELVDAIASLKTAPRRTCLFAFWDAEEIGLLGSKYWISNPTHPLKDVRMSFNLDMVGRLTGGKMDVIGWRSAPGLRTRVSAQNVAGEFEFRFSPRVIEDSDHHSFFTAGIPVLHLDTGLHADYHRPTDDADKLNYDGIHRVTRLVFDLMMTAANDNQLPAFRREATTERPPAWLSARPKTPNGRLGVFFQPDEFALNRAVVTDVVPNSAAARAGVRAGDRLVGLGHWNGELVADLRTVVQVVRNPVTIRLTRPGNSEPIQATVELSGAPVRVGIAWERDSAVPEAVVLSQIVGESPADRAGLLPGDLLLSLGGNTFDTDDKLQHELMTAASPLHFRVERNGRTVQIAVPLFEPPEAP